MTSLPRSAANPMGPWKVAADFHVPEGFSDTSWHNDVNPSVTCDATSRGLYWDTETHENMRAEGCTWACRFFVLDDDGQTCYSGNDLAEAIRIAKSPTEKQV